MNKPRTPDEMRQAYLVQISALESSCDGYDQGNAWEAARLAASIYVLVNDGGRKNQSLITRLGLKRRILFVASGAIDDGKAALHQVLVGVSKKTATEAQFVPLLGTQSERHRKLRFGEWWDRDIIYRNGDLRITRKNLVFALRNFEGGAHFDHVRDPQYAKFAKESAWTFTPAGGQSQKMYGIELATMRQVAWELLESLKLFQEERP
jgi:hypothetical protein